MHHVSFQRLLLFFHLVVTLCLIAMVITHIPQISAAANHNVHVDVNTTTIKSAHSAAAASTNDDVEFISPSPLSLDSTSQTQKLPLSITIDHWTVRVNKRPYFIRGVCYNPQAIGTAPVWTPPWGDFYTQEHEQLWERDLPTIASMGANTIRIWGWKNELDHYAFLDKAHQYGLKVLITFNSGQAPIQEEWQRQNLIGTFAWQVGKYAHHPAVLGWVFGDPWNAPWNGYLQSMSNGHGCGWNSQSFHDQDWGCLDNPGKGNCKGSINCVYDNLFGFFNSAVQAGKNVLQGKSSHLFLVSLTDADLVNTRIAAYENVASAVDGWALQIFRGRTFGSGSNNFLTQYEKSSIKPLVVAEYGVDAYNDPCGDSESTPCYNFAHTPPSGYGEDEVTQADWVITQAKQLTKHSSAKNIGAVAGGCVFEYSDEYWKSTTGVRGCSGPVPYGEPGFDSSLCDWKAHVDCPESDIWYHSLCGWWSATSPDHYTNVAWFGIMKVHPVNGEIDRMIPRLAFGKLQDHWAGEVAPLWIYVTAVCVIISSLAASVLYVQWQRRLKELNRIGYPTSLFALTSTFDKPSLKRSDFTGEATPLLSTSTTPVGNLRP